jgi:hypothetical protein
MAAKGKSNPKPVTSEKPKSTPPSKTARSKSAPLTQTFQPGFWRNNWIPALILIACAFAVYGASIGYGYILDDEMVVWKNAFVQKGFAGLKEIFNSDSFMGYFQDKQKLFLLEGGRYRPLSMATFAMEVGIFGKSNPMLPYISHFVNILLYGLTGVMLYRILAGIFPLREGGRWYFSVAFLASLIFVMHPLHVECVANIKGRDEILALIGSLGALYFTLKYFDTDKFWWTILAGISLFLGLLSKENALTFLAIIPLTLWTFTKIPPARIVVAVAPLLLGAITFIGVRYSALGFMVDHGRAVTDLMNDPFMDMAIGEKFATIFLTLGWYLKLLLIPHPLTHDYYPYHVPKVGWGDWRALVSLAIYAGMGVWAFMNIRKKSVPAYVILFWLATLSIVSNLFVSIGSFMNERFVYMPSIAFCILAAWFFAVKLPDLIKEKQETPNIIGAIVLSAVVILFGLRGFTRVPDWKDALSLNKSAVDVSVGSARAQCYYVTSLYKEVYLKTKDKEEQKKLVDTMEYHINLATKINPNYGAALVMRSAVAAARFEQDHQLDKFFHEIEYVADRIPYNTNFRDFLDQYMKYLDGSNSDKYVSFCHRMGYDFYFKQKRDPETAIHFLQFGLDRQTEDYRILSAMAEIYQIMGNNEKALEMKARADAEAPVKTQ